MTDPTSGSTDFSSLRTDPSYSAVLNARITSLTAQAEAYKAEEAQLRARDNELGQRLAAFNAEADKYPQGAPPDVYDRLEAVRDQLQKDQNQFRSDVEAHNAVGARLRAEYLSIEAAIRQERNPPVPNPALGSGVRTWSSAPPAVLTPKQLQKKFKHALDLGVTGSYNPQVAQEFGQRVQDFLASPSTIHIAGSYKGAPAVINVDPGTSIAVLQQPSGELWSAWKLNPAQLWNVTQRGSL